MGAYSARQGEALESATSRGTRPRDRDRRKAGRRPQEKASPFWFKRVGYQHPRVRAAQAGASLSPKCSADRGLTPLPAAAEVVSAFQSAANGRRSYNFASCMAFVIKCQFRPTKPRLGARTRLFAPLLPRTRPRPPSRRSNPQSQRQQGRPAPDRCARSRNLQASPA